MYEVKTTKTARILLGQHLCFLRKVSLKAAKELRKKAIQKIKSLAENPLQYPVWLPDYNLPKQYRRIIVDKRYMIIYSIDDKRVFVEYVFDGRMDNVKFFE